MSLSRSILQCFSLSTEKSSDLTERQKNTQKKLTTQKDPISYAVTSLDKQSRLRETAKNNNSVWEIDKDHENEFELSFLT